MDMTVTLDMAKKIEAQLTAAAQARGVLCLITCGISLWSNIKKSRTIFARRNNALPTLNPGINS
jgi:hypothetical protein